MGGASSSASIQQQKSCATTEVLLKKLMEHEQQVHKLHQVITILNTNIDLIKEHLSNGQERSGTDQRSSSGAVSERVESDRQRIKTLLGFMQEKLWELGNPLDTLKVFRVGVENFVKEFYSEELQCNSNVSTVFQQFLNPSRNNERSHEISTQTAYVSASISNVGTSEKLIESQKYEIIKLKKQVTENELKIRHLQCENQKQYKTIADPARSSSGYFSWKPTPIPISVQVYFQRKDGLMESISIELERILFTIMIQNNKTLTVITCEKDNDVRDDLPVLVLCVHATRLQTDIQNAMPKVSKTSKLAVVIFHHKDIHALPKERSDRQLTGPEFKELGAIIDMAYLSGKGMYECQMNDIGKMEIVQFIQKG